MAQLVLRHREVTEKIIGAFYQVYKELGPGFLESVYEKALAIALGDAGLFIERQVPLEVRFRGIPVGVFRPDLMVEKMIVVELKAARALESAHEAQLLNCLAAAQVDVGLLLNFGPRPQFKRMIRNDRRAVRTGPSPVEDAGSAETGSTGN